MRTEVQTTYSPAYKDLGMAEKPNARILAIVPAYNEDESILSTVDELKTVCPNIDIIVINDGSSDNTEEILRKHNIAHLNLPCNLGLSGAFQAGMKYAYDEGYEFAIQIDGDGQHDPRYIKKLLADARDSGADIVIGSRFKEAEKNTFNARMLGSSFITAMIKLTTGITMTDPTSGMRLYNRRMIRVFSDSESLMPEPDSISLLIKEGAKVHEVSVKMRPRTAGKSYLNLTSALSYMLRVGVSILIIQPFRKREDL